MKALNQILFAAVLVATLSLSSNASAQYKINEEDGIAASPRVRQMLNERKTSAVAAALVSNYHATTTVASAGLRVRENDGIAASPKLRQQLNERPVIIMVAPVK